LSDQFWQKEVASVDECSILKSTTQIIQDLPIEISMDAFFKIEESLERHPRSSVKKCLQDFWQKGGVLQKIAGNSLIRFKADDAVYPICSGGWCRSQTLWALLRPFADQLILFPPHAARYGWDPYNGQINRSHGYAKELVSDEFRAYFGTEKSLRFGFENNDKWAPVEQAPTEEGLKSISEFYNQNYFGKNSAWQGKQGKRRLYIAFSNNIHVTLYRLIQSNVSLKNVWVLGIQADDLITHPPAFLNTSSRSKVAYENFVSFLSPLLDLDKLLK
jgi:hypothetical protein